MFRGDRLLWPAGRKSNYWCLVTSLRIQTVVLSVWLTTPNWNLSVNNSAYYISEGKSSSSREEARVPAAGLAPRLCLGVFCMHVRAWPCLIQIDSPHVTFYLPTHPPPSAHKTFIRAQPRAARNVCLNKSLSVGFLLHILQACQLCQITLHISPTDRFLNEQPTVKQSGKHTKQTHNWNIFA